jgi:hypothetical protein
MKDFLGSENARNHRNAALYSALIKRACGQVQIMIGHHLTFEGDSQPENEIPSADCLLFDHDLMGKVFGDRAVSIMQHLAATPCESRDEVLQAYFECLDNHQSPTFPPGATPDEWRAAMRPPKQEPLSLEGGAVAGAHGGFV